MTAVATPCPETTAQPPGCRVVTQPGTTPLTRVPDDYVSEGVARWLVLAEGPDAGKRLFFYDEVFPGEDDEPQPQATLLFVHGNPESSYTYRQTVETIRRTTKKTVRVVAMDHIGFGLSDQATFQMVDMHHANNLKQLIAYLDLHDVTLVIHDWGGAIGVGAMMASPERVNNLVLMNTTVFPMPLKGWNYTNFPLPGPLAWNRLGYWMPWRWWRMIPPLVMFSGIGRAQFFTRTLSVLGRALVGRLSDDERLYRDMFSTRDNALSSMRNVKQTKVWGHGYCYFDPTRGWQDNREFYRHIQDNLSDFWGPNGQNIGVRAFWGEWDPCSQMSVRQQWLQALPQLEGHIRLYPRRGHFIEEHEFRDIAAAIIEVTELA